jgi:hypothetical protein
MYDVYYTTAGGPWFNSGADMWVTEWIKEDQPTSKYVYDKNNPVTIALGNLMRPYLIELNRLS